MTAAVDSGDDESSIYVDDILEIQQLEKHRSLVAINQLGEKLRLPLSTPGKFSPQLDVKWYSMVEIMNFGVFPQRVHLVSIQPGQRHRGHDKFLLLKTELETNVLVTVNKELLSLPLIGGIEVMIHEAQEDAADEKHEDALISPPVAEQPFATVEFPPAKKPANTNPFHAEMSENPAPLSPSPTKSESEDLLSLSQEDRKKVMSGSVRRFGTLRKSQSEDARANAPEHVFEIYERLQEKTAECIRLREDANKWRSRFQRLELQQQSSKRQLQQIQRMSEFWRKRVESCQEVDDEVIQLMKDYVRNPTLDMSDSPTPKAAAKRKDVKTEGARKGVAVTPTVTSAPQKTMEPSKLSAADVQRLLTALNMQQYSKVFQDEQVDGGLLLELDDASLQTDLGMSSALHRKKLQRTLQGKGAPIHELLASK